jgi:hypothetical protein
MRLVRGLKRRMPLAALIAITAYLALLADIATEAIPLPTALLLPVFAFAFLTPILLVAWLFGWLVVRTARDRESALERPLIHSVILLLCVPLMLGGLLLGFVTAWLSQCIGAPIC